jgi:hypothetical protein
MAKPGVIVNVDRSHPATHFHIRMIDDDHCQRTACRQAGFPVHRQFFKLPLQGRI